jgi:hypothetical protein
MQVGGRNEVVQTHFRATAAAAAPSTATKFACEAVAVCASHHRSRAPIPLPVAIAFLAEAVRAKQGDDLRVGKALVVQGRGVVVDVLRGV